MYFGLSFSRVGADFRGLLCPIFIEAAHSTFKQAVEAANQEFATDMMSFSLVSSNLAYNQSLNGYIFYITPDKISLKIFLFRFFICQHFKLQLFITNSLTTTVITNVPTSCSLPKQYSCCF